jgi:ferredoxin-NADP reductase
MSVPHVRGWRLGEVVGRRRESAGAVTLRLAVPGWEGHLAGQHVDLRLAAEDGYQAQRSYSIASPPEQPELELTIDRLEDGEVSPYLVDELRVGDELELRGPIGGWFVWRAQDGGPLLLVGGGSGLVPLMAMLRHRAAAGSDVPATIVVSARGREDVLFREELEGLAARDGRLELVLTLTRTRPEGWTGRTQRVDAGLLAEVGPPAGDGALAYVCGPTRFVETVADALVGLGHDPARVRTERFGPTGG